MNFIIVGAQLENKGAESMLYITVDELRKRYPGCEIYFATTNEYDLDKYKFHKLFYAKTRREISKGGLKGFIYLFYAIFKDAIKCIVGKKRNIGNYFEINNTFKKANAVIDVSGFALGEKWGREVQELYLFNIEMAKKYNVPMFLMPQSFGPFDYDESKKDILVRIGELLKYPKVIFAREHDGENCLKSKFDLLNVSYSSDLVLQNKGINFSNIFNFPVQIDVPHLDSKYNVGIIPNKQCFKFGESSEILELYNKMVNFLVSKKYKITIFMHSGEDYDICKLIYDSVKGTSVVHFEEKDFSCVEFETYVQQFDFIICSRYHGLVHALRKNIPVISLGWAIKYQELLSIVGEAKYSFDLTDSYTIEEICHSMEQLINNRDYEKKVIMENLTKIQSINCFDVVSDYIK